MRQFKAFLVAGLLLLGGAAWADGPAVQVTHPWARATAGQSTVGAAYVTLTSPSGDRLIAASSPVAASVEIHEHSMENGVMKMREVAGVALPAGEAVTLKPGGFHIMLMGLKDKLVEGQSFPLTLSFEKAGKIETQVTVEGAGMTPPMASMPGMPK